MKKEKNVKNNAEKGQNKGKVKKKNLFKKKNKASKLDKIKVEKKSKDSKLVNTKLKNKKTINIENISKIRKKMKFKRIIAIILLIVFSLIFLFSAYKCVRWSIDNYKTDKQVKKIKESTDVVETDDTENTEIIQNEPDLNENNPYWKYIKMNLIDVDFTELKNLNSDTVGWLQVANTNINYPFVKGYDNDFYLTHSFNKSYNDAGWVFMDYRNNPYDLDKNTIIYAHSRLDKSMFGTLRNALKSWWLSNSDNFIVKMSMENENTLWQIFSAYHIPDTGDYLKISFGSDSEFVDFANMLINRSAYNFNTSVNASDKILTLSSCYSETEKVVVHAKLIKREAR